MAKVEGQIPQPSDAPAANTEVRSSLSLRDAQQDGALVTTL